jgi:hypothetical protein
VDQRQNKRYRLKASVKFSWENVQGSTGQGEGHTRDISPSGVFVLTSARLPLGAAVKLEVALPSLRQEPSGPFLRTQAHVVRSEELGFAAVADMGSFRMHLPDARSSRRAPGKSGGSNDAGKHEEIDADASNKVFSPVPRFWM